MNDKKPVLFALLVFILGLVFGFVFGTYGAGSRHRSTAAELTERLEQVNRDLGTAISSQREAAERAFRLQTELQGITEYARSLEAGTRRAEVRIEVLADYLNGAVDQSGELADGINRASDSLEESRILLDELGTILLSLPGSSGREN